MSVRYSTYCTIKNDKVWIDGLSFFTGDPTSEKDFLRQVYHYLNLDYPKFYKMDNLSKLGILGVEIVRHKMPWLDNLSDESIALVFQTVMGCLESDLQHQKNLENSAASPSVFVYTLSNIVIGEISIRNKWYGESICLMGRSSDLSDLVSYSKSLILNNKAQLVLAAIIDSVHDQHTLNMFVVEKSTSGEEFSEENLKKIIEH
jgi:hypothetical protein